MVVKCLRLAVHPRTVAMALGLVGVLLLSGGDSASGQSEQAWALPPLLQFVDGRRVQTAEDWRQRRAEIDSLLEQHFIGSFPPEAPELVDAKVVADEIDADGSRRTRILVTWATPHHTEFEMAVWKPAGKGPFPLLLLAPKDYQLPWARDALARGYAVCLFPGVDSHHVEPDYPGYESVWESFRREYPEATWTEISTKGWLASRCLDFLLGEKTIVPIIAEQVAIIGFSRYGKQALVATATDPRIACVVARSPGSPGSCPYRLTSRETYAEAPADFPNEWFLPSLRDYLGREHELPIDAHGWYALIAPRRCLIHTAENDGSEPTFAVEKAYLEGRNVYRFLGAEQNLRVDYRPGGHASLGPERISAEDRKRNLDWIDLAFSRGTASEDDFPESLLHDFDWNQWRLRQSDLNLVPNRNETLGKRLNWLMGEAPKTLTTGDLPDFLSTEESALMTHDRWTPRGVRRVPIRFGDGVRGNLYFREELTEPAPVVVWLHPYSYHSGYNEGYGVEGMPIYHRLAENGFAVVAFDQCGFGLRLREGTDFYDRYPEWSRMGRMVRDARAAIGFAIEGQGQALCEIPALDAGRVYLLGYSAGALTALFTAALDDRVAGTACFSGWTPLREGDLRRLSEWHPLLPRLGLFHGREKDVPVDFDEVLQEVARKPCLLVTPRQDRFADVEAIDRIRERMENQFDTLTWHAPEDTNRFQSQQHRLFLEWVESINSESFEQ